MADVMVKTMPITQNTVANVEFVTIPVKYKAANNTAMEMRTTRSAVPIFDFIYII